MTELIYRNNSSYLNKLPTSLREKGDRELLEIIQSEECKKAKRKKCMEVLYLRHIALVKKITKEHCNGTIIPDCFMRASYGLCYAASKFDLDDERKVKFTTYAYWWIRKEAQRWLSSEGKRGLTSFGEDYREKLGGAKGLSDAFLDLEMAVGSLETADQEIVQDFYYGNYRIREVAKRTDNTEKYVRVRLKQIRSSLRKGLREYELKSL